MKQARQVEVPEDRPLTFKESDELLQHAYNSSVWQLSNYSRSTAQLRDKLYSKGYPRTPVPCYNSEGEVTTCDLVEETLEKLTSGGLVNEKDFVENFIEAKMRTGLGERRIRALLMQKKVDSELVDEAFEESDPAHKDSALQKTFNSYVRTSTFRSITDVYKKRNKLVQHLLTKGFSYDDIAVIVDDYLALD